MEKRGSFPVIIYSLLGQLFLLFPGFLSLGFAQPLSVHVHTTEKEFVELPGYPESTLTFESGPFILSVPMKIVREIKLNQPEGSHITFWSGRSLKGGNLRGVVAEKWTLEDQTIDWKLFQRITFHPEKSEDSVADPSPEHSLKTELESSAIQGIDGTVLKGAKLQPSTFVHISSSPFLYTIPLGKLEKISQKAEKPPPHIVAQSFDGQRIEGQLEEEVLSGDLVEGGSFEIQWENVKSIKFPQAESKADDKGKQEKEAEVLTVSFRTIDELSLPNSQFITGSKPFRFNWKGIALDLGNLKWGQIERIEPSGSLALVWRGQKHFEGMTGLENFCINVPLGIGCVSWDQLKNVSVKHTTTSSPTPPRKPAYAIQSDAGATVYSLDMTISNSSEYTNPGDFRTSMQVGFEKSSFAYWFMKEKLSELERRQKGWNVTLMPDVFQKSTIFSEMEPNFLNLSGKVLLNGQETDYVFQIETQKLKRFRVLVPPSKEPPRKSSRRIKILEKQGESINVQDLEIFQRRRICGNCYCIGGPCGAFSNVNILYLPLISADEEVEEFLSWTDLKKITQSGDMYFSCIKKDDSIVNGTLSLPETKHCECGDDVFFVGREPWGKIVLPLKSLHSIEFY